MHKDVLITGITGFSGSHLAEYCVNKDYNVYGLTRGRYHQYNFIHHLKDRLTLKEGDLSDIHSIRRCLEECRPNVIYHLGAMTSVPLSWRAPKVTVDTNTLGTLNLLESIRKSDLDPKIIVVGTSEEYGLVYPDETPIKETNPLRPLSPYGVSKIAEDLLGYQYFKSYGLKCIRIRPFNIIGTRGGQEIITANLAIQLSNIKKGKQKYIKIGNQLSIRDFTDARDIARAYDIAVDKCDYGEVYNVCSNKGISIGDLVKRMIKLANVDEPKVIVDKERLRPSDVDNLLGDASKFRNKTGWKPTFTLDESILDVLDYWSSIE